MLETLYNWLIGNMGTPGEYSYQNIHLFSTLAVVAATLAVLVLGCTKRLDQKQKRRILVAVSIFHLAFEVLWRLVYVFIKGDSPLCWWPIYPCNLGGVLVPVIALSNWKRGKQAFYLFAFVGACLTFALPEDIFTADVLSFPILKSILQHTGILMIPVFEYASNTYRPTLKEMGWIIGGLLIHVLNCEVISRLLGFTADYMFFRSDMPFVIPGVPQWITLSVFALLVLSLLCLLSDTKGSVRFIKGLFNRKKIRS